jgi:hypothetical protein
MKQINEIDVRVLYEFYCSCKSVHKTGKQFDMTGDSVHRLFKKHGLICNRRKWTSVDDEIVKSMYLDKNVIIEDIAHTLGRSVSAIDARAGRLGVRGPRNAFPVTKSTREKMSIVQRANVTQQTRERCSRISREMIERNGHPKGMLGKKHSEETKMVIGKKGLGRKMPAHVVEKILKTKIKKYGQVGNTISRANATWKAGWREIGGLRIYFRSRWEFNYGLYLELLKSQGEILNWEHEPKTFWFEKIKRGCRSYLPDFCVTLKNRQEEYHEVKGWMDARSATKLKRMAKYYPSVKVVLIQADWFKANSGTLSVLLPQWESMKKSRK